MDQEGGPGSREQVLLGTHKTMGKERIRGDGRSVWKEEPILDPKTEERNQGPVVHGSCHDRRCPVAFFQIKKGTLSVSEPFHGQK